MCLAIPGQIEAIDDTHDDPFMRMAKVRFGGVAKDINLAYVPEANVGDYVIVHVGFALSVIDEAEAQETLDYLRQIEDIGAELEAGSDDEVH